MRRLVITALAVMFLGLAPVLAAVPAAADEGSIVIGVDIAPRTEAADLARAGTDSSPALLIGVALGVAGAAAVAVSRSRRSRPTDPR